MRLHNSELRVTVRYLARLVMHAYIYIGLHTYPLRYSGLFGPMYRSMCWHVLWHAHASTVPYNRKEMSHSARNSLIDVLICLD